MRASWIALLLITAPGLAFANSCPADPAQPACPCGKLPVCVISGHPSGFYSSVYFDKDSGASWEGFGQGESDFGEAITAELSMAAELEKTAPCVEILPMDAYSAGMTLIEVLAEESGLTEKIRQAREAGDTKRLEELQSELDKLFEKYGIEDIPWRNPALVFEQMMRRRFSCIASVMLDGTMADGKYTVTANTSVQIADVDETASTTSGTPGGGIGDLAKRVASPLARAQEELFCSCQETLKRYLTTNFDLSNQQHRCDTTVTCCGKIVKTESTEGPGIGMGEVRTYETKCCSKLAVFRAGEQGTEDEGKEDREAANEIWCPGTWNLRGPDIDCDGIPNAKDSTPWPPGEEPPGSR